MYEAIDDLYEKITARSWANELDALVRLEIIKATGGEVDAINYIKESLKYDAFREIAINNPLANDDYKRAEKLCLEKLIPGEAANEYSRASEWRYLLYEIYDKASDIEKQIQTAEDLLFRFELVGVPMTEIRIFGYLIQTNHFHNHRRLGKKKVIQKSLQISMNSEFVGFSFCFHWRSFTVC